MPTALTQGFAIMRANKEVIFFDAITGLSESYTGSVTKHPLSNGSLITDHTIIDNPKFSVSCILSDADFNLSRPSLSGVDISATKQYINNTQTLYPVQITEKSSINRILPEVIAQFTRDTIPEAFVTPQDKIKTAAAVKQNLIDMWRNREVFTFFEFENDAIPNTYPNCVFTGVGFKEDATTGEGVFPELAFEQVTYSSLKNVPITIRNSKGRQSGKTTTKAGTDNAANAPSSYTKDSVLDYKTPSTTTQ